MNLEEINYLNLMKEILDNGIVKNNRTGIKTYSLFGKTLRFNLSKGFPLLTTKKVHFKSIVYELLWFLKGSTNIKFLNDNKVTIWDEWADENGELGPIYGKQWRNFSGYDKFYYFNGFNGVFEFYKNKEFIYQKNSIIPDNKILFNYWIEYCQTKAVSYDWMKYENFINDVHYLDNYSNFIKDNNKYKLYCPTNLFSKNSCYFSDKEESLIVVSEYEVDKFLLRFKSIDQIKNAIDLIKNNPDSRRILISAWNPNDITKSSIPPCHSFFEFCVNDGKLDCLFFMRSCDVFLGLPFNIASYALLNHLIAQCCNLPVGDLVFMGGDVHIYENHLEQIKIQLNRNPFKFPNIKLNEDINNIDNFEYSDISLLNYESHSAIKADVAV